MLNPNDRVAAVASDSAEKVDGGWNLVVGKKAFEVLKLHVFRANTGSRGRSNAREERTHRGISQFPSSPIQTFNEVV